MNNTPFFTIGIPVYNMAKWVGECLDSILSQDFDDFEIICVDDGSKDNSLEVLNTYAQKDDRIKIVARKNGGVSTARNCIFCYAAGKYIYTIDSDDTMCENVLSRAFEAIKKENYPDILQTGHKEFKNGITTEFSRPYPGDEYFLPNISGDERALKLWIGRTFKPFGSTRFLKSDFIRSNGIMFSQRYSFLEDSAFCFDIYRKADTIAYCDIFSFVYQRSRDNSLERHPLTKAIKNTIIRWEDFYKDVENWNISDHCRTLLKKERTIYLTEIRHTLLTIFDESLNKADAFSAAEIIDDMLGTQIKKLPLPKGQNGIICLMFRIIGIKNTITLLYSYLKLKGVIKE